MMRTSKVIVSLITFSLFFEITKAIPCTTVPMGVPTGSPLQMGMIGPQYSTQEMFGNGNPFPTTPMIEIIDSYHKCPRSVFHFLLTHFGIKKGCMMGENQCASHSDCIDPENSACCQQEKDCCNKCVGKYKKILDSIYNY